MRSRIHTRKRFVTMDKTIELYGHSKRILLAQLKAQYLDAGTALKETERRDSQVAAARHKLAAETQARIRSFLLAEAAYIRSELPLWDRAGSPPPDTVWEAVRSVTVSDLLMFARQGTRRNVPAVRDRAAVRVMASWWMCAQHHDLSRVDCHARCNVRSLFAQYISANSI
jgi:hypothetical protein